MTEDKTMTMTNAEWMIKRGYKYYDLDCSMVRENEYEIFLRNTCIDTIEIDELPLGAMLKWLDMEHEEPILDDAEKRYLADVIRPFRDRTVFVKKTYHNGFIGDHNGLIGDCEQIVIRVGSVTSSIADISLPFFKEGEMYKGMKLEMEYTPEELGL